MQWLKDPVVTSVLGAVIGFLAKVLVDYIKQAKLSREATLRQVRLNYMEEQLSEFYWPLYSRLIQDEAVWKLRESIKDLDDVQRRKIQDVIEKELLFPNHKAMVEILSAKLHLGGYLEVPAIYEEYIRHVAAFRALRAAGRTEPPSEMGAPWPFGLTDEVKGQTLKFSQEYADLLQIVLRQQTKQGES